MTKRCICEICTCGRHRCPHVPNSILNKANGPCQITEYTQKYKPHQIPARESFKPNQEPMQSGTFEDGTTHRKDYIPHQIEKPYVHPAEVYKKPVGEFETKTSYKQEYTEKHAPPARAIKNEGQRMIPAKFEGNPTYKQDYRPWDIRREPGYAPNAQWEPPKDHFQDNTTFKSDYKPYQQQPRQSYKPVEGAKMSDSPFDDHTDYRDSYQQHPLPPKHVRQREEYKPSGAPLDGLTTHRKDYKGFPGNRMQSFKPDNQAFQSEAPLEDKTTMRQDYRPWETQRPYVHPAEQYKPPEGQLESDTSYKSAYREMPIVKSQAVRPASANRGSDAPFDGNTNYKKDYQPWQAQRVFVPRKDDYVPNQAPFQGDSTYKGHYHPHNVAPARSYRPDNQAFHSDAPFDDGTMYRHDYTKKEIQPCPAAVIDQGRSRYKFLELTSQGHRLYAPVSETVTPIGGVRQPSPAQQRLAMSVA